MPPRRRSTWKLSDIQRAAPAPVAAPEPSPEPSPPAAPVIDAPVMDSPPRRRRTRSHGDEDAAINQHVGQRVRLRRSLLGISQERLGDALGLSFQQVQKYERGANRISAGTLLRLARVLDVPVSFFYDDFGDAQAVPAADAGPALSRRTLDLVRHFNAIGDAETRDGVYALVKSLAGAGNEDD